MMRLTLFELNKIWKKRSFIFAVILILFINLFLLWYTNLSDGVKPPLPAYKAVGQDISGMDESEKFDYLAELKERMDGIAFVREVLSMQSLSGNIGSSLAEQKMAGNPGVFEEYYEVYQNADYLKYTGSLEQESALINELYEEQTKVAGYGDYLDFVQNNRGVLSGISIFAYSAEPTFSSRNIDKSAADYAGLKVNGISWFPSKGITSAMEGIWTDILLLLSVFLFISGLIVEEKEKGLFYITRATKHGMGIGITAKLMALLVHCIAAALVIYGCNLLFFEGFTGLGNLTASVQSIAPYMDSTLNISVLAYILLSILSKGLVLFFIGSLLTAVSIFSRKTFMPYLCGIGVLGISWIFYQVIPTHSVWNLVKYLNPMGLLRTENLYGAYLNFNVFGFPVSRLLLSWLTIGLCAVLGIGFSILLFFRSPSMEMKRIQITLPLRFRTHNRLFAHESYKILIANRAIVVLLLFAVLLSWQSFSKEYRPSVQEQYYQSLMLQLEGELTEEKTAVIKAEQHRYDDAFAQIDRIDAMVAKGEIDENTGESMKQTWYGVTAFYPAFEKMLTQYEKIETDGGKFIYDTGYLYLFGVLDNSFAVDLLLISLCMIFGFANVISMEYQKKSWYLLCATQKGKRQIVLRKIVLCLLWDGVITVLPWIFRSLAIAQVYPMQGLTNVIQAIPYYQNIGMEVPIWCFLAASILSQLVAVGIVTVLILLISWWRKSHLQALFFSLLLFAVPVALKIMGLDFAGWFSIYPIYAWPGLL